MGSSVAVPWIGVPRRLAALAVTILGLTFLLLGWPAAAAATSAILVTLMILPDRTVGLREQSAGAPRDLLAWLPVGAGVAFGGAVGVIAAASLVGVPLWAASTSRVSLGAGLVILAGVSLRRGGRVGLASPVSVAAWLPAALVAVGAAAVLTRPMAFWSRPVWSLTDWLNHGELVVDLLAPGRLIYAEMELAGGADTTVYPRGLHAVLAWLSAAEGGAQTAAGAWSAALWQVTLASWTSAVLVVAGAGLLAGVVAGRLTARAWVMLAAAALTGVLLLHPYWFTALARSGFITSAAAAAAVIASLLVLGLSQNPAWLRVIVLMIIGVGLFHVWQPLAAVSLVLVGLVGIEWWRTERRRPVNVVVAGVVTVVVCIPLAGHTLGVSGVDPARLAGVMPSAPAWMSLVLITGAAAVSILSRRRLAGLGLGWLLSSVTLLALAGVLLLRQGVGKGEMPYYAAKVLWLAGILALPVVIAGSLAALAYLPHASPASRLAPGRPMLRWTLLVAPIVLLTAYIGGGLWHGLSVSAGTLGTPAGSTPQVAMLPLAEPGVADGSGRPVLPYLLHPQGWSPELRFTDWHAAQLARAFGAQVPGAGALIGHDPQAVCAWLGVHPDAVRLTGPRLGFDDLLDQGCPSDIVRAEDWSVLVSPAAWWADTPWERFGGLPDPEAPMPSWPVPGLGGFSPRETVSDGA